MKTHERRMKTHERRMKTHERRMKTHERRVKTHERRVKTTVAGTARTLPARGRRSGRGEGELPFGTCRKPPYQPWVTVSAYATHTRLAWALPTWAHRGR